MAPPDNNDMPGPQRLEVTVLNADLRFTEQALLVGHYRSTTLTGAAVGTAASAPRRVAGEAAWRVAVVPGSSRRRRSRRLRFAGAEIRGYGRGRGPQAVPAGSCAPVRVRGHGACSGTKSLSSRFT